MGVSALRDACPTLRARLGKLDLTLHPLVGHALTKAAKATKITDCFGYANFVIFVNRQVRVLPNAESVTERDTLEQLYGVDLLKSKVILTEYVLPMDAKTYVWAEAEAIKLEPGWEFWIGFFLDDNDHPYTDYQELIQWSATFGMLSPKEEGAIAVCE